MARLAHDVLLDLLLRQPRGGAKREDGDRQYLASVIVLVSELDISALGNPVIFAWMSLKAMAAAWIEARARG